MKIRTTLILAAALIAVLAMVSGCSRGSVTPYSNPYWSDINRNDWPHEVADAVLFSNYFAYGENVFTINRQDQILATDVNKNRVPLEVADMVYLTRIIVGDALPYPKVAPLMAYAELDGGELSVDQPMAAAFVVVKGNAAPTNWTDMDMVYNFDGVNTRILLFSFEQGETFAGNFLRVNNEIVSVEFATYEGQPVTVQTRQK